MKEKHSPNGYAAIEAVLILVIAGLVGFVGWYVNHVKSSAYKNYNAAAQAAPNGYPAKPKAPKPTTFQLAPPAISSNSATAAPKIGDQAYFKINYQTPAGWSAKEAAAENDSYGFKNWSITLTSPDYKETSTPNQECYTYTGRQITISVYYQNATLDQLIQKQLDTSSEAAKNGLIKDAHKVSIAGQDGVQSYETPGECYITINTDTIYNNHANVNVSMLADGSMTAPNLTVPSQAIYNQVVSSISFSKQ